MWGIRDQLRAIAEALKAVVQAIGNLHGAVTESTAGSERLQKLESRLDEFEQSLRLREADAEAALRNADSKLRAARSSEERARRYAQRAELDEGELEEDADDPGIHPTHAAGSGGPAMPAMYRGVEDGQPRFEPDPEQAARALKWRA